MNVQFNLSELKNIFSKRSQTIIGRDEYLNSAVLIPFVYLNNEYSILFEKRANHIRQGGEISFPGGEVDPELDKSSRDTAIRETVEELGISKNKIKIISPFDVLINPNSVIVEPFIAELKIKTLDEINFDKKEVSKVFSVPISYFFNHQPKKYKVLHQVLPYTKQNGKKIILLPVKELKLPAKYSKAWNNKLHNIYVYQYEQEVIWGLTARIVVELIKKIKENKI